MSRRILSVDKAHRGETVWLACCWADCEDYGVELHKSLFHDHARGLPCSSVAAKHLWYVFCSNRHKQYFDHAHIRNGYLPVGERGGIL